MFPHENPIVAEVLDQLTVQPAAELDASGLTTKVCVIGTTSGTTDAEIGELPGAMKPNRTLSDAMMSSARLFMSLSLG